MSKYWGIHNDEDEVAYSSEHPKVRYEYKQAKCRLSQKTSSTDLKNFFTHIKSLSMPKRKGTTRDDYLASLENKLAGGLGEDGGGVVDIGKV